MCDRQCHFLILSTPHPPPEMSKATALLRKGYYPDVHLPSVYCRVCRVPRMNNDHSALESYPPADRDAMRQVLDACAACEPPTGFCGSCGAHCCWSCYTIDRETDKPVCSTCESCDFHVKEKATLFDVIKPTLDLESSRYAKCAAADPRNGTSSTSNDDDELLEICERCDRARPDGFWCKKCNLYACAVCSDRPNLCYFCDTGDLRPTHKAAIVDVLFPTDDLMQRAMDEHNIAVAGARAGKGEVSLAAYDVSLKDDILKVVKDE